MPKLNILLDKSAGDKIDSIKQPIGGKMRKVFESTPIVNDKGKVTGMTSAYESAKAAFDAAAKAAGDDLAKFEHSADAFRIVESESTDEAGNITRTYGDFDPDMRAVVAVVGARERDKAGKMESGIRGLVLFPMPSTNAFVSQAEAWLSKVVEKEAAHVAFRALRNSTTTEEFAAAGEGMPTDVESFVAQYQGGDGLDTDTFDAVWTPLRNGIKEAMPKLYTLLPQKQEVLKSIRSAAYAKDEHPELESKGVFVYLANLAIGGAESYKDAEGNPAPMDASAIKEWLESRETTVLATRKVDKDFSILENLDLGFGEGEEGEEEAA